MNVLKELINVMNTVTIPLVVILVTVLDLAIDFTVMEALVKVYIILIYCSSKIKIILLSMIFLTDVLSDINECTEGINDCAQLCTDTDGSYLCACSLGFSLKGDSYGCDGNGLNKLQ